MNELKIKMEERESDKKFNSKSIDAVCDFLARCGCWNFESDGGHNYPKEILERGRKYIEILFFYSSPLV